ncbi:MAG: hypothetical protein AAGI52_07405 [Bacteroidota bacterium]
MRGSRQHHRLRPPRQRGGATQRFLILLALVVCGASLPGCGDTFVDPFLRDEGSFSMYGVLLSEGSPDVQRLRVQLVRALPDPPTEPEEAAAQLGSDVASVDLVTGDSIAWTERQIRFPDGTLGSVFERAFRPVPGRPYRLSVTRRSDGERASATLTIPPTPRATISEPVVADRVTQAVAWDAARIARATLSVRVSGSPTIGFQSVFVPVDLPLPGEPVEVDLDALFQASRDALGPLVPTVYVSRLTMTVLGASEEWPLPPDDLREMAQPGAYSNVDRGYGFIGAGTQGTASWQPDAVAMRAAGFEPIY